MVAGPGLRHRQATIPPFVGRPLTPPDGRLERTPDGERFGAHRTRWIEGMEPMSDLNRFLEGSFAPVTEEVTAFGLPVTGQLPAELSGRYLRNGPNPTAY